jgi:hypothetical protein
MMRTWTHSRARRWTAIAGGGLATVLVVAGCSADDPGSTPPSPSSGSTQASAAPTPSPSASSVVVKPERPAEMDDDGAAGAEAAAQYFLELDSYIQATNDTAEWEAMSHQECEYCANRLDQAREIAKFGDTYEGGKSTVKILETYEQDTVTGIWPIDVEILEDASQITSDGGEVVFENEANVSRARVEIGRRSGEWVIVGVTNIPES